MSNNISLSPKSIEASLRSLVPKLYENSLWVIFGLFAFSLVILSISIQSFSGVQANQAKYDEKLAESQLPTIDSKIVEKLNNPSSGNNNVPANSRTNPFYE